MNLYQRIKVSIVKDLLGKETKGTGLGAMHEGELQNNRNIIFYKI
jgi:hypothetical protein